MKQYHATYFYPHPETKEARLLGERLFEADTVQEAYQKAMRSMPEGATHCFVEEMVMMVEIPAYYRGNAPGGVKRRRDAAKP